MGLVAATIATGANQANAYSQAAKDAENAANKNISFEQGVYNQAQQNFAPTITAGNKATDALSGLENIGGSGGASNSAAANTAFQNYLGSTNYQFQLGQGENAITYGNAPAYASGATEKALNNYAQGQAGNALAGYEGLLQGQAGLGTQAASSEAGVGTNIASQEASANNSSAAAQGNAAIGSANAFGTGLANLEKLFAQTASQSSFGG